MIFDLYFDFLEVFFNSILEVVPVYKIVKFPGLLIIVIVILLSRLPKFRVLLTFQSDKLTEHQAKQYFVHILSVYTWFHYLFGFVFY